MIKEYYLAGIRDSVKHTVARWIKGEITQEVCNAIIDAKLNSVVNETKDNVYSDVCKQIQGGMCNEQC